MAKTREYSGENITVRYDARRCIHAAECVKGLPSVFDAKARPWIQPDAADADAVADAVERCPTGALSYRRTDGGPEERPAESARATVVKDGPIYVRGRLTLHDPDGVSIPTPPRAALCRCGASKNKPFCDNSHLAIGFTDGGDQ